MDLETKLVMPIFIVKRIFGKIYYGIVFVKLILDNVYVGGRHALTPFETKPLKGTSSHI